MIELSERMIGKKVKYIGDESSSYNPTRGSLGTIVEVIDEGYIVQWEKNSTKAKQGDCWWCCAKSLQPLDNIKDLVTDEEIWEMLKGVMENEGLKPRSDRAETLELICKGFFKSELIDMYDAPDVEKAVALAYRLGYERASNNLPFKIEEAEHED